MTMTKTTSNNTITTTAALKNKISDTTPTVTIPPTPTTPTTANAIHDQEKRDHAAKALKLRLVRHKHAPRITLHARNIQMAVTEICKINAAINT